MGQDREDGQGGAAEVVPPDPQRIVPSPTAPHASSDQTPESESPTPDPPPVEPAPAEQPVDQKPLEPDQAPRLFSQRRKPKPLTYEEFLVHRRHLRELSEARQEEHRILRWELLAIVIVVVIVIIRQLWLQ